VTASLIFTKPAFAINKNRPEYNSPPGSLIQLNRNENPYGLSPKAIHAINASVKYGNRYPNEARDKLKEELASRYNITKDHIFITAGSNEVLCLVVLYASKKQGNLVTASPTYAVPANYARALDMETIIVPLTTEKVLDLNAMAAKVNQNTSLVYVCNPNGPTGTIVTTKNLAGFCSEVSKKTKVLVDEAYLDFVTTGDNESMIPLVENNRNVIISKTFSKIYGMAGLRVGYVIAHPDTIKEISSLHMGAGLAGACGTSMAAASASLADEDFYNDCLKKIKQTYAYTAEQFTLLKIPFIPSHGNFIFFNCDWYTGDLNTEMKARGVAIGSVIKDVDGKWIRLTIGTNQEMKTFFSALKQILK
jgi:histidinol-phosphate aminotransferase